MAYAEIEPYGALHDEFRTGQLCAITANVHRDPNKGSPLAYHDFMPALQKSLGKGASDEPVLLDDPEAQSALLAARLFGKKPDG